MSAGPGPAPDSVPLRHRICLDPGSVLRAGSLARRGQSRERERTSKPHELVALSMSPLPNDDNRGGPARFTRPHAHGQESQGSDQAPDGSPHLPQGNPGQRGSLPWAI